MIVSFWIQWLRRLSKNKKLIAYTVTACMYKNSNAPSNNTGLWYYFGTKHLDFRHENNSTPGVLIEELQQFSFEQ